MHNNIHKKGRARYNNSEWYQCGPVCLMRVCCNACLCMCGATLYTPAHKRQACFLPNDMVPFHGIMIKIALCCTVVHCWSRLFQTFGETLLDHTRQSLVLESPVTAQYAIARYTTMCVNSLQHNGLQYLVWPVTF